MHEPSPLERVLADACEFARRHGADQSLAPQDFGIQRSGIGLTNATYVDGSHAVAVLVDRHGTTTFAVGTVDWLHNQGHEQRHACTEHCHECPECRANPCECPAGQWEVYRDPADGAIRRTLNRQFVAGEVHTREHIETLRDAYGRHDDPKSVRMRKIYDAALALIDQEAAHA